MSFARRILTHGTDPTSAGTLIENRAITGAQFTLHRHGGAGEGELRLRDDFATARASSPDIGDWISFEYKAGERWYLGRIEERTAQSPAEVAYRLEGPAIQLNEIYPGGFAEDPDAPPHRIGLTDLFSHDPDYTSETWDTLTFAGDAVEWLLDQYIVGSSDITKDLSLLDDGPTPEQILSYKFRGEESARALVKQLALLADGASWGVLSDLRFFFLAQNNTVRRDYRIGRDLTDCQQSRDRELLFNRLLLTGGYIYPESALGGGRPYRYRTHFVQPHSVTTHGERRIRLWIPWIRTDHDATAFAREFFRIYSQPTTRYHLTTKPQSTLYRPWEGRVRLSDVGGAEIAVDQVASVRVHFDHAPTFELTLGPVDPHTLWPEPPHDERWELPSKGRKQNKKNLSLTSQSDPSSILTSDELTSSSPPRSSELTDRPDHCSTGSSDDSQEIGSKTPSSSGLSSDQSSQLTSESPSSGRTEGDRDDQIQSSSACSAAASSTPVSSAGSGSGASSDIYSDTLSSDVSCSCDGAMNPTVYACIDGVQNTGPAILTHDMSCLWDGPPVFFGPDDLEALFDLECVAGEWKLTATTSTVDNQTPPDVETPTKLEFNVTLDDGTTQYPVTVTVWRDGTNQCPTSESSGGSAP